MRLAEQLENWIAYYVVDGTETRAEAALKVSMTPMFAAAGAASIVALPLLIGSHEPLWLGIVADVAMGAASGWMLLSTVVTKMLSRASIVSYCAVFFACICAMDVVVASSLSPLPAWPLLSCIVNVLLVSEPNTKLAKITLVCAVLWVIVTSTEHAFRWGLFDVPGTASVGARWERLECKTPPCASGASVLAVCFPPYALALNFLFVLFYATRVRNEEAKIETLVALAGDVGAALAFFDIDKAAGIVGRSEHTPLHDALHLLLFNLQQYRPYLPDAMFNGNATTADEVSANLSVSLGHVNEILPKSSLTRSFISTQSLDSMSRVSPKARDGRSSPAWTVATTGIQNCGGLWAQRPVSARKITARVQDAVRLLSRKHGGTELCAAGDRFTLLFLSPTLAVRCCLGVIETLVKTTWPKELVGLRTCATNTLRMQFGVCVGPVEAAPSEAGIFYHGPSIRAAQLLISDVPYANVVALRKSTCDALHPSVRCAPPVAASTVISSHPHFDPSDIYLLLPLSLEPRKHLFMQPPVKAVKQGSMDSSVCMDGQAASHRDRLGSSLQHAVLASKLHMVNSATAAWVGVDFSGLNGMGPSDASNSVTDIVASAASSADRTDGVMTAVQSSSVVVVWNAAKRCPSHAKNASLFVGLLRQRFDELGEQWSQKVFTGVCTGSILHGNTGDARHRHIMHMGACLDLVGTLSDAARNLGVFATYASFPQQISLKDDPMLHGLLRPVDTWVLNGLPEPIVVYQLRDGNLASVATVSEAQAGEPLWGDAYAELFAKKDWAAVSRLCDGCPVLTVVAERMRCGAHVVAAVPQIGFHRVSPPHRATVVADEPMQLLVSDMGEH
ncbi:hypothetical protein DIPPA_34553 [Diplonema papillatum]|nr:hypothetical protein DIPPA_34553 [Diplonema papillatum]